MSVERSPGVVLPAVAASLMGAGSVLAFGLIASPGSAEVRAAEPAASVLEASTAPAPITITRPAETGRAVLAADPVRHPRAHQAVPRTVRTDSARSWRAARTVPAPSATPFIPADIPGDEVPPARVAPPPVTLVREVSRQGRLVTVRIIDPALATPRTTRPVGTRRPASTTASTPASTPASSAWRRGAVGG